MSAKVLIRFYCLGRTRPDDPHPFPPTWLQVGGDVCTTPYITKLVNYVVLSVVVSHSTKLFVKTLL